MEGADLSRALGLPEPEAPPETGSEFEAVDSGEVRRIEAQLALAKVTTKRRTRLHASENLAPQELDEAVYSEEATAAGLEAARAAA